MDWNALQGLHPNANKENRQLASDYFDFLKSSADGWQLGINVLQQSIVDSSFIPQNIDIHSLLFYCMQVLEFHLKSAEYINGISKSHKIIRMFIENYSCGILSCVANGKPQPTFLRNKFAQLVALVCVADFPVRWPELFHGFMTLCAEHGALAVDLLMKVLAAVDSEVIDKDIVHTAAEMERNNLIKDALRDSVIEPLSQLWLWALTTFEVDAPDLVCAVLDQVGLYVSWIDIGLIANDTYVARLLQLFCNNLIREKCCDCVAEILSKGMPPMAKFQLVENFYSVLASRGLLTREALSAESDEDYLARTANLLEVMGRQLLDVYQRLIKEERLGVTLESCSSSNVLHCLEAKVDLALLLLGHDDDAISSEVATLIQEYIALVKTFRTAGSALSEACQSRMQIILQIIIRKMKYEDSYDVNEEGEEEAMFQEYRKELKVILMNLCALNSSLVLHTTCELLLSMLTNWRNMTYADVEVALLLFYYLGEALPASKGGDHFVGDSEQSVCFRNMMTQLCLSGVSSHPHPLVVLQYLETVARFDKFFRTASVNQPELLGEVLAGFLDSRGLRHGHPKVRARSAYLLSRFVKTLKSQVEPHAEQVLRLIQDLLQPLVDSQRHVGQKCCVAVDGLSVSDRVFVYETAGVLIASGGAFAPQRKAELFSLLLAPLADNFPSLCVCISKEVDSLVRQQLAEAGRCALDLAGRTSKAFNTSLTMHACCCTQPFLRALRLFLDGLHCVPSNSDCAMERALLSAGVRGLLHRLVVCLGDEVLVLVPDALSCLLPAEKLGEAGLLAEPRDLNDTLALINQLAMKFKQSLAPLIVSLAPLLLRTVAQTLAHSRAIENNCSSGMSEARLLVRGYFNFITCLLNSGLGGALMEAGVLESVLESLLKGAQGAGTAALQSDYNVRNGSWDGVISPIDPQVQKICFGALRLLMQHWSGMEKEAPLGDWLVRRAMPCLLHAPASTTWDFKDAQTMLALQECAACHLSLRSALGAQNYESILRGLLPIEAATHFVGALQTVGHDCKSFANFLKSFYGSNLIAT